MTTQNSALVRDNSTLANFKSWGSTISAFFTTAGWTQSSDSGQVNWSTLGSVPGVNTFVYEIWEPNDGLTNFFLKVEYGTISGSTNTQPAMRVSIGTNTTGAGVLSGFDTTAQQIPVTTFAVTSTSATWQCYFCGRAGQIQVMMWRDETVSNGGALYFSAERSINSSGSYTSTHVTLLAAGSSNSGAATAFQQSLVLATGVGNAVVGPGGNAAHGFIALRNISVSSDLFNANIPFSPVFPSVGFFDNPLQGTGVAGGGDITEGSTYVIASANMPYGVSHTYLASKATVVFANCGPGGATSNNSAILMRYD